jgi:glycosyltransferase involved in cell wall biosynthesis
MIEEKLITIVIPCFNEDEVIDKFCAEIDEVSELLLEKYACNLELIFVDDGSTDQTFLKIQNYKNRSHNKTIRIIQLSRNFGHQNALICGYNFAKGDGIVSIDADLQDPPLKILELVSKFYEGWDVILAERSERIGDSVFKKFTAKYFYKIISIFSATKLSQNVGDFRCVSRRALQAFLSLQEKDPYIRGMFSWIGFKETKIKYSRDARFAGKSKYSVKKMLKLAIDGLFSFSGNVMRFALYLSLILVAFTMLSIFYLVISKIINPNASSPGYISLMIVILGTFALQLFILGIMGEYLFKNFTQMQKRPTYIVMNEQ